MVSEIDRTYFYSARVDVDGIFPPLPLFGSSSGTAVSSLLSEIQPEWTSGRCG